jgi:hypothetical protein
MNTSERRNNRCGMNAASDRHEFAQNRCRFGEGVFCIARAKHCFSRKSDARLGDYDLRGALAGSFRMFRCIHINQVSRTGAFRRRDTLHFGSTVAFECRSNQFGKFFCSSIHRNPHRKS